MNYLIDDDYDDVKKVKKPWLIVFSELTSANNYEEGLNLILEPPN
jgi:hypothetical protein